MFTPDLESAVWRKSSYSGQGGDCVEVAYALGGAVPVRDSKQPSPVMLVSEVSWASFLSDLRDPATR
ncbi:DUF397 domain-containing protein [Streptomyces sp. AJS327]|nr:DUF397 domain-containing protein [Streptomyces sp. AJS327]